ncbi:hypothetical protein CXF94_23890 [Halomonas sp. Choline-3u-9]|nr:hypothetical protein CXF94_23890 [Halomonas sp. Choline-3u-9]
MARAGNILGATGRRLDASRGCLRTLATARYKTYTPDDSRFTIHDSRFTIHDSRFTIHDSRFTIHDSPKSQNGNTHGVISNTAAE